MILLHACVCLFVVLSHTSDAFYSVYLFFGVSVFLCENRIYQFYAPLHKIGEEDKKKRATASNRQHTKIMLGGNE